MKICILGDVHIGCRGDALAFHKNQEKFYSQVLFPYLKTNNIDTIFQLGDLWDRRKYINFYSLYLARKNFFDPMADAGIKFHTLLGNHDISFRNTLSVNASEMLLSDYKNITVYSTPTNWNGIDIIPWICSENETDISEFISNSKNEICFGHFELNGFEMDKGIVCTEGRESGFLSRYDIVLTGHFHHRSIKNNICYVGTPTEMTWHDYDDNRGFHVYDTETRDITFVPNPHTMFHKVIYDENVITDEVLPKIDFKHLTDRCVKVLVKSRTDYAKFEAFIERINQCDPYELAVVDESPDLENAISDEVEVDEAEDTVTVLSKYIDTLQLGKNTDTVKSIMRDVYSQAIDNETA